jgi:hypothetical protein
MSLLSNAHDDVRNIAKKNIYIYKKRNRKTYNKKKHIKK